MTQMPSRGMAALRANSTLIAAAALVAASVLFGGASRQNPLRLGVVELSSVPLLLTALRQLADTAGWRPYARLLWILAAIYMVGLVQLAPLPPAIWTQLPGHAAEVKALQLAGLPLTWRPISLAPQEGFASVLALIPPTAMLLGALCLDLRDLRRLILLWLGLATLSVMLGVLQLLWSADGSWTYPYSVTHYGSLVGFFANRNHEATFLLCMMPLAAVVAAGRAVSGDRGVVRLLAAAFILLACVALAVVRSRTGVILAAPAILACGLIVWLSPSRRTRLGSAVAGGAAVLAVAFVGGAIAFGPVLARFELNLHDEPRFEAWPIVERAADNYLPLGSGIGSFDLVFRSAEPLSIVQSTYFNHAHNEYLETWLETGWLGIGVFLVFLAWFIPTSARAWLRSASNKDLATAASVIIALVLAHSFVDYPLRTTTISILFAYACALLARCAGTARRRAPK